MGRKETCYGISGAERCDFKNPQEGTMKESKKLRVLKAGSAVLIGLCMLLSISCAIGVYDRSRATVPDITQSRHFKTYFLKQKLWTLGDHFNIVDEHGNPQFVVQGKVFTLGDKLRLYNTNGQELVYIKQKLLSLKKQYKIYRNQRLWARVMKKITLFKDVFIVDIPGPDDYIIRGDFTDHLYTFIRNGKPVAFITKKWFSWGDSYMIEIDPEEDDVLILSAAIVIDMTSHDDEYHHSQTQP
jgi:uncharacterized protein YxjI